MNGQVIGVITATLDQLATLKASGTLPQNVNYALKFDYVIPLLRYHFKDMLPKQPSTRSTQKVKDLIEIAEPSVVLLIIAE